ncbi:MAG: efflux RND transporter permease subunit, partial [Verrucomicrobia bacterium]|nr:efflux RND transporter permease subunit [Verrucomicrobiota bacterium]
MNTGFLRWIIAFSLHFRAAICAVSALLMLYGLYTLYESRYDVFPEFAPPEVVIQTEAPGLSSQQVEMLVTQRIETAVSGIENIDTIRSSSIQGLSVITIIFKSGSNIYYNRQGVTERLASVVSDLPTIAKPVITPLTSSMSVILAVGLTSKTKSLMDLRTIAEWDIQPRLVAAPGVASVVIYGAGKKQLQIQLDQNALIKYNLSMSDVVQAASKATAIQGAGFIETENQRIDLFTEGQSLTPDELEKTVVLHEKGENITLSDLGRVLNGQEPPFGYGTIMGENAIILLVSEQYGANTLEVTKNVDKALAELSQMLKA